MFYLAVLAHKSRWLPRECHGCLIEGTRAGKVGVQWVPGRVGREWRAKAAATSKSASSNLSAVPRRLGESPFCVDHL